MLAIFEIIVLTLAHKRRDDTTSGKRKGTVLIEVVELYFGGLLETGF